MTLSATLVLLVVAACGTDADPPDNASSTSGVAQAPVSKSVEPESCIDSDTVFNPNSPPSIARYATDIFAAKVASIDAQTGGNRDPRTQVTVTITKVYKGTKEGKTIVAQQGNQKCLVNGVPIVSVGEQYIFATNREEQPLLEIWHGEYSPKNDRAFSSVK